MAVLRILSGGGELFDIELPEGAARDAADAVELLTAGDTGPGRERLAALLEPLFPRKYRRSLFHISGEDALRLGRALLSSSPCPAPAGPDLHREETRAPAGPDLHREETCAPAGPDSRPEEDRPPAAPVEFAPEELVRAIARNAAARERFRRRENEEVTSGEGFSESPSGTRADK
ncbi:MAG: hypothetical protein IJT50_07160 [Lentisphaeria bacterium]|nr:hypothetical protein [Lentisphaeria bacterium]